MHRCDKQNTNAHSCCCCFLAFTLRWYALASVDPADTAPASIFLTLLKFPTANPSRISSPWSVSLTSEPFYTSSQNPAKNPPTPALHSRPPPSHPLPLPPLSFLLWLASSSRIELELHLQHRSSYYSTLIKFSHHLLQNP